MGLGASGQSEVGFDIAIHRVSSGVARASRNLPDCSSRGRRRDGRGRGSPFGGRAFSTAVVVTDRTGPDDIGAGWVQDLPVAGKIVGMAKVVQSNR